MWHESVRLLQRCPGRYISMSDAARCGHPFRDLESPCSARSSQATSLVDCVLEYLRLPGVGRHERPGGERGKARF
eukprot:3021303-Prorocentrum_lima.AAC.1